MKPRGAALLERFQHPAQVVVSGFGITILIGTALLSLPHATADEPAADPVDALFTATSAVCLTGLITQDTASHWSLFGELVILGLMQVGGLGLMTVATLFGILLSGRVGLRARMAAQVETKTLQMPDVRRVVRNVVLFSLTCEALVAVVLAGRLAWAYGEPPGKAVYLGVFHSVSAFNNAGLVLWRDSLMGFVGDPWICLPICAAVMIGGLGFPVVFELARRWRRPRTWSILTRVTVGTTTVLLVLGAFVLTALEWNNDGTLGTHPRPTRWLAGAVLSVMPRSGGFNSVDTSQMRPESWLVTDVLMFIGGGSAGTAGGIKVTTFGLLAFVLWAEMRGDVHVNVGTRRLPPGTPRQAMAIVMLSAGLITVATIVLMSLTGHALDQVLFEVVSATATVGLSTGITGDLPMSGEVMLVVLMFVGRIGPLTLATALALRKRTRRYELPEERPIVG
ncbi:ATPase [Actinomadura sp. CNU-125]|uniref:TrkH family potassium uptake protein n=1 Tax=Actinomadura sp. CNU-125 TaxID=1904961 RepID=UPI00096729A6|nr:potassium transporter TrkG [Actinomadura sp. CNU-125]OLT29883.1 ATPase [Actinomadura sp. CNU-125]